MKSAHFSPISHESPPRPRRINFQGRYLESAPLEIISYSKRNNKQNK